MHGQYRAICEKNGFWVFWNLLTALSRKKQSYILFSELRTMYRGFGDLSVILISVKDNS